MIKIVKEISAEKLCEVIVEGMQDNKAEDIVVIDLREVESAVTDFFVIASGESTTQVDGIANAVVRSTRKTLKEKPWHQEGKNSAQWVLLDYVNVVAHVFHKDVRDYYELEDLWADGKKRQIANL
ncbi:ribosome silencing factor [Brumimicrobium mesophilum]|uniref:ribosome silencing factor n=1 Tax=Brumimicrobium mesophilum TaxID=392717 RepID=UPI000D1424A4|nr:ribosome silencing factor [Brumimicrobium mesophilum]